MKDSWTPLPHNTHTYITSLISWRPSFCAFLYIQVQLPAEMGLLSFSFAHPQAAMQSPADQKAEQAAVQNCDFPSSDLPSPNE